MQMRNWEHKYITAWHGHPCPPFTGFCEIILAGRRQNPLSYWNGFLFLAPSPTLSNLLDFQRLQLLPDCQLIVQLITVQGCWVFWLQCPFLLFFLYSSLWKPRTCSGFQDGELPGFLGSFFLTSSSASFQLSWSSYYSQHRRCGVLPPVLGSWWSLLLDPSHTLAPSFSSFSGSPFLRGVGGAQPCY